MSNTVENIESIPEAKLLLRALRSVGYTEEAAIADIIDNSLAVGATEIEIMFEWEKQRIIIKDNGTGMSHDNLIKNMRIGSADPNEQRDPNDLGRFGMGMKTAAFSLGKRLTVVSKTDGEVCNATWDLDAIPLIGWNLIVKKSEEITEIIDMMGDQGTIVLIEELDRLIDLNDMDKAKKRFFSVIRKVISHIMLTFHRFISDDNIRFIVNNTPVEAWDPFITANSATQELADEIVLSDSGASEIVIQPYVVPHKTKYSCEDDYKNAGGPKGWNYHQGVYLYRNKRLIICGTWFDYIKKEPAYNLARIKVDITSDSDEDWKIDIKKSSAAIPIYVRDNIERAIDICTEVSARVYNSRGSYEKSSITTPNLDYVWEQKKKGGKYSFHINRKHELLGAVKKQLNTEGISMLVTFLALVENFAPFMISGIADSLQVRDSLAKKDSVEYQVELDEIKRYMKTFLSAGFTKEETKSTLLEMAYYKHLRQEIIEMMEGIS